MPILLLFAFLGGFVTILSPCILPILPVVLSGSLSGGKRRPLGIVSGFILSFTFFTLFLTAIVKATNLPADGLRSISVVVILLFGLSLLLPGFQAWMERQMGRVSRFGPKGQGSDGFAGGLLVGLSIGLVWTPCVGPILAGVITLAITSPVTFGAFLITLSYALGTSIPLLLIVYGGRNLLNKVPWLLSNTERIQKGFGVIMILAAIVIQMNWDRSFQTWVLEAFPRYGTGLTALEDNARVRDALDELKDTGEGQAKTPLVNNKAMDQKDQTYHGLLNVSTPVQAPELKDIEAWINSDPLTIEELKGKVVLIDFWTYSCINCIRTLPALKAWNESYADDGLVIIGVHTPEFAFEHELDNVQQAVSDFEITYPVALDNNFGTWKNFDNHYWPAKYFIDRQGRVRHTHFGEGEYEESEEIIRLLLAEETNMTFDDPIENVGIAPTTSAGQTPETYLGYGRAEYFANVDEFPGPDQTTTYTTVYPLSTNYWTLAGDWQIEEERSLSKSNDSKLTLRFNGKDVYLIMGSDAPATIGLTVDGDALAEASRGSDVDPHDQVKVQDFRLYRLVEAEEAYSRGLLELTFPAGVAVHAFTFGS